MRDHDYERADEDDRLHFIQCSVCGKWIDVRDLAEVMEHQEHEPPLSVPDPVVSIER